MAQLPGADRLVMGSFGALGSWADLNLLHLTVEWQRQGILIQRCSSEIHFKEDL